MGTRKSRREAMFKRLEPIVVSCVQRYCLPSNSREDLMQAGWLGAARAIRTWREGRGSSLTTWTFIMVRKAVTTARAKEMVLSGCGPAAWRDHGAALYTTEMPVDDVIPGDTPTAPDILIERERHQVLLTAMRIMNRRYSRQAVAILVDRLLGATWGELERRYRRDCRPMVRAMTAEARGLLIARGIVE